MKKASFIKLGLSMVIFGTIGVFLRFIDADRGFIATARGIVGALFLLIAVLIMKKRPSILAIRKNFPLLLASGTFTTICGICAWLWNSFTWSPFLTIFAHYSTSIIIMCNFLYFSHLLTYLNYLFYKFDCNIKF